MRPADEVAEDVLEAFGEEVHVEDTKVREVEWEPEWEPERREGEKPEGRRGSDEQPQQEEGGNFFD